MQGSNCDPTSRARHTRTPVALWIKHFVPISSGLVCKIYVYSHSTIHACFAVDLEKVRDLWPNCSGGRLT